MNEMKASSNSDEKLKVLIYRTQIGEPITAYRISCENMGEFGRGLLRSGIDTGKIQLEGFTITTPWGR